MTTNKPPKQFDRFFLTDLLDKDLRKFTDAINSQVRDKIITITWNQLSTELRCQIIGNFLEDNYG